MSSQQSQDTQAPSDEPTVLGSVFNFFASRAISMATPFSKVTTDRSGKPAATADSSTSSPPSIHSHAALGITPNPNPTFDHESLYETLNAHEKDAIETLAKAVSCTEETLEVSKAWARTLRFDKTTWERSPGAGDGWQPTLATAKAFTTFADVLSRTHIANTAASNTHRAYERWLSEDGQLAEVIRPAHEHWMGELTDKWAVMENKLESVGHTTADVTRIGEILQPLVLEMDENASPDQLSSKETDRVITKAGTIAARDHLVPLPLGGPHHPSTNLRNHLVKTSFSKDGSFDF
ncbi:hypothetical protein IAT38_004393 [Cryptococcus sp. DSM 104549]